MSVSYEENPPNPVRYRKGVMSAQGEGGVGSWVTSQELPYHSRSLYMIVKKTWRNRLTAFITTAKRYNHASPDMLATDEASER